MFSPESLGDQKWTSRTPKNSSKKENLRSGTTEAQLGLAFEFAFEVELQFEFQIEREFKLELAFNCEFRLQFERSI